MKYILRTIVRRTSAGEPWAAVLVLTGEACLQEGLTGVMHAGERKVGAPYFTSKTFELQIELLTPDRGKDTIF